MLTYIKEKVKGWLAWTIVVIIVIPFALFGIGQYLNAPTDVVIAEVGSESVLESEYLSAYQRSKSLYQANLGDEIYNDKVDANLRRNAIQEVVRNKILDQYSQNIGLVVSDEELKKNVLSTPEFLDDSGNFSLEKYQTILRLNGLSEPLFEVKQKNILRRHQFSENLLASDFILGKRQRFILDLLLEERQFSLLTLDVQRFVKSASPKAADIKAFYDKDPKKFVQPRLAKVSYVMLSSEDIEAEIELSEDELASLYEQEKQNLAIAEKRQAKHILVSDKTLAEKLLTQLRAGGDFDALAQEHSEDHGSKNQGGDLGYFERGVMVPEFEEVAFKLEKGSYSDTVKTEFGYHIIYLSDIIQAQTPSFESVKEELISYYKSEKVNEKIYKMSEDLANASYGNVDLAEVAKEFNLSLETTDFFSENDQGKQSIYTAKFIQNSFTDAVYNNAENSEVFETQEGVFIVLRLLDKKVARAQTFSEVEAEIKDLLKSEIAKQQLSAIMEKLKNALGSNQSELSAEIMQKYQLKWQESVWIDRGYSRDEIPQQLKDFVFSTKFDAQKPTFAIQMSADKAQLVRIEKSRSNEKLKIQASQQLKSARTEILETSILQSIVESTDYKILNRQR